MEARASLVQRVRGWCGNAVDFAAAGGSAVLSRGSGCVNEGCGARASRGKVTMCMYSRRESNDVHVLSEGSTPILAHKVLRVARRSSGSRVI
eukprot:762406-Rhodomonas_salina.1